MHFPKIAFAASLAGASLMLAGTAAHAAADTYLALGDSYAYGFTTVADAYNPAVESYYGLQGYVKPVGAALGAQQTINLAIVGETTASFVAGKNDYETANFNYGPAFTASQESEFGQVVAAQTAAGHTISDITIQLGGNDLLGGLLDDPTFFTKSPTAQQTEAAADLQTIGTNYAAILGGIAANPALAQTHVYVIGYFDPFADLGTNDPFGLDPLGNQLSGDLAQALNSTLKTDADAFGFHFVNPYDAFRNYPGNHADLTYIHDPLNDPNYPSNVPNFHPKAAGYNLLAQQIETAAAVPESSSLISFGLLLALGLGGLVLNAHRCKAQNSA